MPASHAAYRGSPVTSTFGRQNMSKPWITFLLIGWTIALLVLSPFLFSIYRTSVTSMEVAMPAGLPPIKYKISTRQSILDWTGRLSTTYTQAMFDDEMLFYSAPGQVGYRESVNIPSSYILSVSQDGKPIFTKNTK